MLSKASLAPLSRSLQRKETVEGEAFTLKHARRCDDVNSGCPWSVGFRLGWSRKADLEGGGCHE